MIQQTVCSFNFHDWLIQFIMSTSSGLGFMIVMVAIASIIQGFRVYLLKRKQRQANEPKPEGHNFNHRYFKH